MPPPPVSPTASSITASEPVAPLPSSQSRERAEAPKPAGAPQSANLANPSLLLEPSLGLVVIQFRDAAGAVTLSIPSARQIAAYLHPGSAPPDPDADRRTG